MSLDCLATGMGSIGTSDWDLSSSPNAWNTDVCRILSSLYSPKFYTPRLPLALTAQGPHILCGKCVICQLSTKRPQTLLPSGIIT